MVGRKLSSAMANLLSTDVRPTACASLPSSNAAADWLAGVPGSGARVVGSMAGRAALIGTGLYVAGFRGRDLVKGSLFAATAIEIFVLAWILKTNQHSPQSTAGFKPLI